ncbi:hypothetical protein HDF16_000736 [Granulicella aggregans]|uniref:Uncharacterized protein n=1 Tax=Granulicella aggregans TaxID=474949 RepID=A0A7W7ZAA8_9BACT|nr:hypothetical protein [Granulicella aggregans]
MEIPLLRSERYELPPEFLNETERKERDFKLLHFRNLKEELVGTLRANCDRQVFLLRSWNANKDDGIGVMLPPGRHLEEDPVDLLKQIERLEALIRLINHSRYCPQCVTFPVEVPYYNPAVSAEPTSIGT